MRKKKPKNVFLEIFKVAIGAVAGLVIAQLIVWWGLNQDPFQLAPKVPHWVTPSSAGTQP